MNEKALELGLDSTTYADPSGLDPRRTCRRRTTWRASSRSRRATSGSPRSCGRRTTRCAPGAASTTVHSTNQLVMKGDVDVRGGKTGFISKAGYCLATLLRLPQTNQQVAVVVLGARSNAGRFMETRHLFNWLSTKAQDFFPNRAPPFRRSEPQPAVVRRRAHHAQPSLSSTVSAAASPPRRAAASRSCPRPAAPGGRRPVRVVRLQVLPAVVAAVHAIAAVASWRTT